MDANALHRQELLRVRRVTSTTADNHHTAQYHVASFEFKVVQEGPGNRAELFCTSLQLKNCVFRYPCVRKMSCSPHQEELPMMLWAKSMQ